VRHYLGLVREDRMFTSRLVLVAYQARLVFVLFSRPKGQTCILRRVIQTACSMVLGSNGVTFVDLGVDELGEGSFRN
jgi:hypothetical protein